MNVSIPGQDGLALTLATTISKKLLKPICGGTVLAFDPLEDDETYQREAVIHGEGEYVNEDAHVNTCESRASLVRRWLSPHRGVSKDKLTPYLRVFQLRRRILRKPGRDALREIVRTIL